MACGMQVKMDSLDRRVGDATNAHVREFTIPKVVAVLGTLSTLSTSCGSS